jgi:hypothetical protein
MKYAANKIESTLKGATVAASAGFSTADWANHVFVRFGEEDMVGNVSVGRLPVVTIREVESQYTFTAEPDHEGDRDSQFIIRIYVPTFVNRSEDRWQLLQRIKQAALSQLTQDLNLGSTDVQVAAPVITQCSIYQDVTLNTNTSYDKQYLEGNN